ncbi:hypothetical protein CFP65_4841 [Kitasatospora sp. MMS16-BH015]|uniref:hypothetical protein n=1 Tax=Kitasatospora sp. MMS16-BH015 TaxID=2018025 RepID=UPI000CA35C7C|nr:hypothetical protein [Kitasatospora sp. MMS16-BH015]AUG79561.1 hypothetical protein CFP65_4841 [Kitasatospora sp. MMS16-BH015]
MVSLYVHEIRSRTEADADIVVRCMEGPVQVGARFDRFSGVDRAVDLELIRIFAFHRPVEWLDPVHTGLVTLGGADVRRLAPGQTVRGTNPG